MVPAPAAQSGPEEYLSTIPLMREDRVHHLEALINEQLKSELQRVQDERDQLYERISDCMELRNNMSMLQDEHHVSLKTMVDVGCDFYVQARMCAGRAAPACLASSCL